MSVLSSSEFLARLVSVLAAAGVALAGWLGPGGGVPAPESGHWRSLHQQMDQMMEQMHGAGLSERMDRSMPGSEEMMEACAKAMAEAGLEKMPLSADEMQKMMEGQGMRRMMEGVGPGMPGMPLSPAGMGSMMQGTGPGTTGMMARMMMGMMGGMMPSGMMGGR